MSSTNKKSPATPLAFRPVATSKAVQPKVANSAVNRKSPIAPPAYRPQPVPRVLQTKRSPTQNLQASKALAGRPVSPLETKEVVQPKAVSQQRKSPTAPPAYRPVPKIAQPKMAALTLPGQQGIRALTRLHSGSVVQRMMERKREDSSDDEAQDVDIGGGCNYPKLKGEDPWNDAEAMIKHCLTYCGGAEKIIWVKFAYIAGAPPPELGHGSELAKPQQGKKKQGKGGGKQGSAKDAKRWQSFQKCMEGIIDQQYSDTKGKTPFQKAEKIVNAYRGKTPGWW